MAPNLNDLFLLLSASGAQQVQLREPQTLVERSATHGLSGVVLNALSAHAQSFSEPLRRQLTTDARAIAGQTLKLRMLLTRTLQALRAQGIVPVVLKGYSLGARIYPDALLRPSTDVDVFVREAELSAAAAAMAALQLQPQDEESRAYFREHHHHLTYSGPPGMVEVHFRLITGFGAAIDWEDLQAPVADELEGVPFARLTAEDELCYLALHAAQHVFSRLSWLYDLKQYVEAVPSLDWTRVVRLATDNGFAVPLWAALSATRTCFAARLPAAVIKDLRPSHPRAAALDALLSPQHLHDGFFHHRNNLYFAQLLMTATANRAVQFAAHHGSRAAKRRLAQRFPSVVPRLWRG